jgi:pimeloyl-ACP methyl ester carboxylesterase
MSTPETKYADNGRARIAYQVIDDGPRDLVVAFGYVSHVERIWDDPLAAAFLRHLASFSRVILFDKRGTGLSGRVSLVPTLEQRMDDMLAVMDGAGVDRATLLGIGEGGYASTVLAACHPERIAALIVFGNTARITAGPDYPFGVEGSAWRQVLETLAQNWGHESSPIIPLFAPSHVGGEAFDREWARYEREAASGATFLALGLLNAELDLRSVLPFVRVPTLVLHRERDILPIAHGRYLAEAIPGATFIALPGGDRFPWLGDAESVVDAIQTFVAAPHPPVRAGGAFATVLVLDIRGAAATSIAELLPTHQGARTTVVRDGRVLAAFDGPIRAVNVARAIRARAEERGLEVRAGVHAGDVETTDGQIVGPAVPVAEAIAEKSGLGEMRLSATAAALIPGSGILVKALGMHTLADAARGRRLFAVEP